MNEAELEPPLCQSKYPSPKTNNSKAQRIIENLKYKLVISSHALQLSSETRFATMVLFHRFICCLFAGREEEDCYNNLSRASVACIFLACKLLDESHIRIRDVLNLWHVLIIREASPNSTTAMHFYEASCPPDLNAKYWENKDAIVSLEQDILRWINFDSNICHPHRAVIALMNHFYSSSSWLEDEQRLQMLKECWKLLNDTSLYIPALRHSSLALASAVLYLSSKTVVDNAVNSHVDAQPSTIRAIIASEENKWWLKVGVLDGSLSCAIYDVQHATLNNSSNSNNTACYDEKM